MLAGLFDLTDSELDAFAREARVFRDGLERQALLDRLLGWMASRVGSQAETPEEIERAVLEWLAARLELEVEGEVPVDQLEAAVRRKVAEDSYEFLYPFLAVGTAVTYLGPVRVIGPKLELLEASSAVLIPSHSARERMRQYWAQRAASILGEGQVTPQGLLEYFRETLTLLAETDLETRLSILVLNHVVALSDGRYDQPEELFMLGLADLLKVDRAQAERVRKEVSETFWKKLTALGGGTYHTQARQTDEELALNMQAAQATLEETGGLVSFGQEVEQGFVATMRRSLQQQSAMRQGGRGGALGFARGMLCYVKRRWNAGDHEIVMRLSLASIFRQHLAVTGDKARITSERIGSYLPQSKVENVADTLAETAVGPANPVGEVKRISLDPKLY